MHARVRHGQFQCVDALVAIQQQVQIKHARRIAKTALAAKLRLQRLQLRQQRQGGQRGVETGDGVDKVRLVGVAHWRGDIQ